MEPEARYTYVGAAVLVLVAALAAGVVWLKDVGRKGDFNYYAINFEHQSLNGLEIGADVNLRGIKVGRVEDYALTDNINRVRVLIRIDRRTPVSTNTVAVVNRRFVTGIIWLKHTGSRSDYNFYTIYFERQPLDGLQIGADVSMRGIKVGRVEDYALTDNIHQKC